MLDKILCQKNLTLLGAMEIISAGGKGTAFIVNKNHKLIGVLTDGDIRRALLCGARLTDKVKDLMGQKFIFARTDESRAQLLKKISDKIRIIPIVDEDYKVVDYFEYQSSLHVPVTSPNLGEKEFKYLTDAFLSTWISSRGKYLTEFEKQFAKFCGCKYGVGVTNGTVALHLALVALGIKAGDEVIVPDLTFAATINAVLYTGATPVIVDVEKNSWCIDPKKIRRAITPKTKAIIPVHLYGQPCNMEAIMKIARKHKLFVIEDCAEAHGAEFANKKVGSWGHVGCFSFFGNKIITTGEGGMCVTNSKKLASKMRILKDHGMSLTKKYWHSVIGFNYRMTNLQAAIGLAQLERIKEIIETRQNIENNYRKLFKNTKSIELQKDNLSKRKKITWLFSMLIKNGKRDEYMVRLKEKGIDTRPFFYPLSSMPIYRKYCPVPCRNSMMISKMGINLPTEVNLGRAYFQKLPRYLQ